MAKSGRAQTRHLPVSVLYFLSLPIKEFVSKIRAILQDTHCATCAPAIQSQISRTHIIALEVMVLQRIKSL